MATAKKKSAVTRKKSTAKTKKATPTYKTLRVQAATVPFLSFKVSKQTLYWTILLLVIVLIEGAILVAQSNEINATNALTQSIQANN